MVMYINAARVVDPKTLELFVDDRIFVDLWDRSPAVSKAPHIQLTRWADLFVVVPATANVLGKAANGIADDLLSTAILASPKPVVFVPVMNPTMLKSKAVQRNIETLRQDGHYVISQDVMGVAVGSDRWEEGMGGSSPETLLLYLQQIRMKMLKEAYWDEAVKEQPLTPFERRRRALQRERRGEAVKDA
jgi:phosphopantothenoylcysteine decarboxylase/phosphopantothenate--cysteine ligase